jgi:hypothetical protein
MKLYEISEKYLEFANLCEEEEIPDEVIKDTFDLIKGEFAEKADNLACLIKNFNATAEAIKTEVKALQKRQKQQENAVQRIKNYLQNQMSLIRKSKIETPRNKITIRKNPVSIEIGEKFIPWAEENADEYLKYLEPVPNKTLIKEKIKNGEDLPFVRLIQIERLEVK